LTSATTASTPLPDGVFTVQVVELEHDAATDTPPNVNFVLPRTSKFVPVMVTICPPLSGP
jgi:hypothetical protein